MFFILASKKYDRHTGRDSLKYLWAFPHPCEDDFSVRKETFGVDRAESCLVGGAESCTSHTGGAEGRCHLSEGGGTNGCRRDPANEDLEAQAGVLGCEPRSPFASLNSSVL